MIGFISKLFMFTVSEGTIAASRTGFTAMARTIAATTVTNRRKIVPSATRRATSSVATSAASRAAGCAISRTIAAITRTKRTRFVTTSTASAQSLSSSATTTSVFPIGWLLVGCGYSRLL